MAIKLSDNFDDAVSTLRKILYNQASGLSGENPTYVIPTQSSNAPSNSAAITTAANVTIAAGQRLFIQNLDTDPLFVKRGTGASSSSFNYVLQAGGVADDGTGGAILIDDFIGTVSFAGTTVRYNAWIA